MFFVAEGAIPAGQMFSLPERGKLSLQCGCYQMAWHRTGKWSSRAKVRRSCRFCHFGGTISLKTSEPRFSTPCDMRFFPRDKGKMVFFEGFFLENGLFPVSRGKNRVSQGVDNRGSLIKCALGAQGFGGVGIHGHKGAEK